LLISCEYLKYPDKLCQLLFQDLNKPGPDGRNALHFVASRGMVQQIKDLRDEGVNPLLDNQKESPLDLALENKNDEVVKILKKYNIDLALQLCSIHNDCEKIKELLEMGANPKFKNKWGGERNAFQIATKYGNTKIFELLVEKRGGS
jgi:ankyrin repeat protein